MSICNIRSQSQSQNVMLISRAFPTVLHLQTPIAPLSKLSLQLYLETCKFFALGTYENLFDISFMLAEPDARVVEAFRFGVQQQMVRDERYHPFSEQERLV